MKIFMKLFATFCVGAALTTMPVTLNAGDSDTDRESQMSHSERIARGANAWANECNRCHNLRNPKELEDYEWTVSITHMQIRGQIPEDLARDIEYYLKNSN